MRRVYMRNRLLDLIQAKQRAENRLIPQKELTQGLGMSANTLKKWIAQDVQQYDQKVVDKICSYFGVQDVSELFYLEFVEETA